MIFFPKIDFSWWCLGFFFLLEYRLGPDDLRIRIQWRQRICIHLEIYLCLCTLEGCEVAQTTVDVVARLLLADQLGAET